MLDWTKIERGKIIFKPEELKIVEILNPVIELMRYDMEHKGIKFLINVPENLIVHADKNMLSSILRNLLTNAVKFSNSGGSIAINITSNDEDVIIQVKDSGSGIKQEILNDLFTGVTIESKKGTAEEQGSGVGLSLCKEFVDFHRGKIWAENNTTPDTGASIFIKLPKNQEYKN